jgi:hypothetical protein
VPSCEPCGTYYNPNTLGEDGKCPVCGAPVVTGEHAHSEAPEGRAVPWHFWVAVVAVTVYLTWRLVQGVLLLF